MYSKQSKMRLERERKRKTRHDAEGAGFCSAAEAEGQIPFRSVSC